VHDGDALFPAFTVEYYCPRPLSRLRPTPSIRGRTRLKA
jgi:hypothetical protein